MDSWAGLDIGRDVKHKVKFSLFISNPPELKAPQDAEIHNVTLSGSKVGLAVPWLSLRAVFPLSCVSGEAVSLAVLRSYSEVAAHLKGKEPQGSGFHLLLLAGGTKTWMVPHSLTWSTLIFPPQTSKESHIHTRLFRNIPLCLI